MPGTRWFKNLPTFGKLMVGFGLLSAIMLALGCVAMSELKIMQANTEEIYVKRFHRLQILSEIDDDVNLIRITGYQAFTSTDRDESKAFIEVAVRSVRR